MKKVVRIGLTCVGSFALALAVWALVPANHALAAETASAQAQSPSAQTPSTPQSVSGKIASVEKSSFTLTVGGGAHVSTTDPQAAKSMTFQVDQNTTIDGKLKVGANADVTYRSEGGNNIAISVRVS